MPRSVRFVILLSIQTLFVASSAGAITGPAMIGTNGTSGTASNTGAVSGNSASYAAHTWSAGGATVSCADANFTVMSTSTTSITVTPSYSGCALLVSGTPVAAATVHTTYFEHWETGGGVFNNVIAFFTGARRTTTGQTTATVTSVNCQLNFAAQTMSGLSGQNINSSGGNDTSATPWGIKVAASSTAVSYTVPSGKSCPGVTSPGTGTYTGTVALRNVFGTL